MNSFEILITLLFIVTVYAVIVKQISSEKIIGGVALCFTIGWIGFDNMGMWSNSPLTHIFENCGFKSKFKGKKSNLTMKNKKPSQSQELLTLTDKKETIEDENLKKKLKSTMQEVKADAKADAETKSKSQTFNFKPIEYSEENYKYNLFDEIGCLGDNMLAHKMKQVSNKNREAIDNFSRTYSKYSNINYFDQELKDAEASRWWDNEDLEKDF